MAEIFLLQNGWRHPLPYPPYHYSSTFGHILEIFFGKSLKRLTIGYSIRYNIDDYQYEVTEWTLTKA